MTEQLKAPFPYFGGKRKVVDDVWQRFGKPKQYIEPFCGSAAMLLGAPQPASLEVAGDANGYIANFWRALKYQPAEVAEWADYPVSHVDLGARHKWLLSKHRLISEALQDAEWPGDPQVAGWWLWGQCAWIGGGWCEKIPHVSDAGQGIQAAGGIPHVGDAGRGIQAAGQIPHVGNAGQGIQAAGKIPHVSDAGRGVQASTPVQEWLHRLSDRLARVRLIHGDWARCLNHHYGGKNTAIFFDPPYLKYEGLYQSKKPVAAEVADWCREHSDLKIALAGHVGDYDLPGWDAVQWSRGAATYGSTKTTDLECIWYSPACEPPPETGQIDLFHGVEQ